MEESPYAKFRAFSARARDQGLVLHGRQGKRVFVFHLNHGTLTVLAEPGALASLVRFAADRAIRPSPEFITELLDLRIERAELAEESDHYVWRDLHETSTRVSLGEWMQGHGYKRMDLSTTTPPSPDKSLSPPLDDATVVANMRTTLIDYWISEGELEIDMMEEEDISTLRTAVESRVASFSDEAMLRLHALNEEVRDEVEEECDRIGREMVSSRRGSDPPPSAHELGLERALAFLQIETKVRYEPPDFFGRTRKE